MHVRWSGSGDVICCASGIFFRLEVSSQNDAYVCRDRYWVEFVPAEDRDGAHAPVEDAARRPRGGAAGRERLSDGGDLAGSDGSDDSRAEAVSKAVQLHVVDKVRVVATSAMRDARNAAAFTEWVKSTTGWNVEVISGLEEGRLIHLGVVTHEAGARGRCLLIDLGGGSCEVTLSDGGRIKTMVSMPLGAVRLQQEFLRSDPPAKEDVARLKQFIDRELRRAEQEAGNTAGGAGDRDVGNGGGAG